jgi:hypothetical protein
MRRLAVLIVALSLLAYAGAAAAGLRSVPPQFPKLSGRWSHAEINVTIRRQQHTLVLDHGQIARVGPNQIVLRRFDGTVATVPVGSSTIVTLAGVATDVTGLRKGEFAQSMIVDDGAAVRVKATFRP